jgi:hypothetical protein
VQQVIIIGKEAQFSHSLVPQYVPLESPFMHFEGWRGASLLSPIEKVWSHPHAPAPSPLQSPDTNRKEVLMNDTHPPLPEAATLVLSENRARRSRNKLTLLSARAVSGSSPERTKKNGRHQWTKATRFKRQETFPAQDENGITLKSSNEKHEGIAQQVLIGWCVFLTLASMAAIIL